MYKSTSSRSAPCSKDADNDFGPISLQIDGCVFYYFEIKFGWCVFGHYIDNFRKITKFRQTSFHQISDSF